MAHATLTQARLRKLAAALFDEDFYLAMYPDVRESGQDAFAHYMKHGWREGRDPSPAFSTRKYLIDYPDVAASGANPLTHFVGWGAQEGRQASSPRQWSAETNALLTAVSVRESAKTWAAVPDINRPLAFDALESLIRTAADKNNGLAVLSLSHDQYSSVVGGVQSVIAAEAQALNANGWLYIHLSPAQPLPMLADSDSAADTFLVLTLNGQREGVVRESDLLAVVQRNGLLPHFVVHHSRGFSAATILRLAHACHGSRTAWWVHDFFSVCANPFLLRNDREFCAAPSVESSACMICTYGDVRHDHLNAMRSMFAELQPLVIAPSVVALDFWRSKTDFAHDSARIVPPAHVTFSGPSVERTPGPLRIAHLGPPLLHKGWPVFESLVTRHRKDSRYEFFVFGATETHLAGVRHVQVQVTPEDPDAMVRALTDHDIDVAVIWSACYESFSLVALESVAAGAFVVARRDAGNVWPAVKAVGEDRGLALPTVVQLEALLLGDKLTELATRPRLRGTLQRASGTADLLLDGKLRA
jgi:hypothetical protein